MLSRIGSGTGIFTRALLAHIQWNAAIKQIKAIEPSEGMRSVFSQQVKDDRVTVAEGTFISTGIADSWADLVVIAQVCVLFFFSCSCCQFYHRLITGVPTMKQLLQNSLVSSSPTALLLIFGI
jgi:phospholipid N-methyltransferase